MREKLKYTRAYACACVRINDTQINELIEKDFVLALSGSISNLKRNIKLTGKRLKILRIKDNL